MFTENFLSLDSQTVAKALAEDGVFSVPNALTPDAIAAMLADVEDNRIAFNRNGVSGAYYHQQYYMCHMLAVSRTFTQLVTHPKVFEITERVVGADYRLKALRYYETYGLHHMQWHTDNKTDRGFATIPGIIFIVYLGDVADGEFQYIRGSQAWSGEKAYNDYSDAFVEETLSTDILSFKGEAGTLVVYDTYGIHRARPVPDPYFVRKSLFWQIDREMSKGEPLLINPEFLPAPDPKVLSYLGFGLPTEYHRFPETGIATIAPTQMREEDFTWLETELAKDLKLQLERKDTALAEARQVIRAMPAGVMGKMLLRRLAVAAGPVLPGAIRRRLEK